jgi:hypothetical protein
MSIFEEYPTMTAAELRFEQALDEQAAHERGMDPYDDYAGGGVDEDFYYDNPDLCPHEDRSYTTLGVVKCDMCESTLGTWSQRDENDFPIMDGEAPEPTRMDDWLAGEDAAMEFGLFGDDC